MTFNSTELKIEKSLLDYQNGRHDADRLTLGELSTALTGLFFSLADILEHGQDELPRTENSAGYSKSPQCRARGGPKYLVCTRALNHYGDHIAHTNPDCEVGRWPNQKPDPIRMSAANSSEMSKAYITGTKDGLATAKSLVERKIQEADDRLQKHLENCGVAWGRAADAIRERQQELRQVRGTITAILLAETNRTEKAQEGK